MQKKLKQKLLELADTMIEANYSMRQLIKKQRKNELTTLLADLQDAALSMGNQIEASEGEGTRMVQLLEEYCEELWKISQCTERKEQQEGNRHLMELMQQELRELNSVRVQIDVVFLPYKASMWDCMESVWRAAEADPNCNCYVIPIPYADLEDGEVKEVHYEGDRFPEYVPITHYSEYSIEERCPEIAYIHNPFDEYNLVTTVASEYYSYHLKPYVEKLIYIPYYIANEAVAVTHRDQPSYYHVDYIVVQCEEMIESFAQSIPREKFLPYGSPIADRIIRLQENRPEIPEAWKPMLPNGRDFGDKKVVMFNTSITQLLKAKDRFLDKVEYVLRQLQTAPGVLVVWRPHPLLHISARMVSPEFADRLQRIEDWFLAEKIGVLDKTADVGIAAALCDAYLGEKASSIVHIFGVAGKPGFYLNLIIPEEDIPEKDISKKDIPKKQLDTADEVAVEISGSCETADKIYYLMDEYGWIVEKDKATGETVPLVEVPGRKYVSGRAYGSMSVERQLITVYPDQAEGTFSYHLETGRRKRHYGSSLEVPVEPMREISLPRRCVDLILAEKFKEGNPRHIWGESENCTLIRFLQYLQTTDREDLAGDLGPYRRWLANLDGTCGEQIHRTVVENFL